MINVHCNRRYRLFSLMPTSPTELKQIFSKRNAKWLLQITKVTRWKRKVNARNKNILLSVYCLSGNSEHLLPKQLSQNPKLLLHINKPGCATLMNN